LPSWVVGNFRELFSGAKTNFSAIHHFELGPWNFRVFIK
jgi:hypothetical protein